MKKTLLMFLCVSLVGCLFYGCGGGGGGSSAVSGSSSSNPSGSDAAAHTAIVVPDPPADDPDYFQIMIDNQITSQTLHFTVVASRMPVGGTAIAAATWLTGSGASHDDWTTPVFQTLNTTTGVTTADFASTYDFTLDKLPLDSSGRYRILKIPFRDPGDPTYTLGGSGRVYFTVGTPGKLAQIPVWNSTHTAITGYAISQPSPDPAATATGGQDRWDFMEFNCAKPNVNGKKVAYVNTTNVDSFALGVTIEGRTTAGTLTAFGLSLADSTPVANTISALTAIGGDYAAGYTTATSSGAFLRFRAPSLVWSAAATALQQAIDDAWTYYTTHTLQFNVGTTTYTATNVGGNLVFTAPVAFTVAKPNSLNVVAATGPLDVAGKASNIQDGLKFLAAFLNRGVFENTAVWYTSSAWYPAGSVYNKYAYTLHQRFVNGATYGFSFDDVPGNGVTSDPSIPDCTAMTLVTTIN